MIKITYSYDANEGRTHDEPVKPNKILSKTFRNEQEYEEWINRPANEGAAVRTFVELPAGGGLLGATARQLIREAD